MIEDLFSSTNNEGFEVLDVEKTLAAMRNHSSHNGVQLDAIKHLLSLSNNSYVRSVKRDTAH
jgi:hypothetical protein